jgi:predicted DNA-binding protein
MALRIDEEDERMLELMAKKTTRTKSDMVRFLIRQEFERGGYELQQGANGHAEDCTDQA